MQALDGFRGSVLDRIGYAERSRRAGRRRRRSITVWPSSRAAARADFGLLQLCIARSTIVWPSTTPVTPSPGQRSEFLAADSARCRSSAPATIADASGCSLSRSTLAASRSTLRDRRRVTSLRLAFGQRAGLVDHQRVDFLQRLQRLARCGSARPPWRPARCHHDGHRRRQAQRARARDDQHRHGVHQRMGQARLRARPAPRRRT